MSETPSLRQIIAHLRKEYALDELTEATADPDPFRQFAAWFADAQRAGLLEPNAMTLATVTPRGPEARVVLLKGFDDRGFVFFTNYDSDKGQHIAADPRVALTFWWDKLERQVRVTGTAERVPRPETEAYFAQRPRGSQLGAWASAQSAVVPGRAELEARLAELTRRFEGQPIPPPPNWGGYRVAPATLEFWQGRRNRLHDRLRYRRQATTWLRERLSP